MKLLWTHLFFFLTCISIPAFSQTISEIKLENQIAGYNDAFQYEKSIAVLTQIISDENASDYDKYVAFLLKSHTYKRLFNYPKTLEALNDAYEMGIKTDQKDVVKNIITAEKSFVYFDTNDYQKAANLMTLLVKDKYQYLDQADKAWIVMQEGYLQFLDKNFALAEKKYDESIAILSVKNPDQLPNIYGKKVQLYNEMKLVEKRNQSFEAGVLCAKKYKKIKYEMYLYEIMKDAFQKNNDFKNAFLVQQKFDSITKFYRTNENNGKIEVLEQNLTKEKQELLLKNEKYQKYLLFGCIAFLFIVLYFTVRLYRSNKDRRLLAERENVRIYRDIERLTKILDEKGAEKIDFSKFNLSSRQLEILELIKSGLTNKEIANKLCISENTVKYHLKVIYDQLDIENRYALKF